MQAHAHTIKDVASVNISVGASVFIDASSQNVLKDKYKNRG